MVMNRHGKTGKCPYCGSEKLTAIDWGFANWECDTCRNNFKKPYYPKDELATYCSSDEKGFSIDDVVCSALGYFMAIFLVFCLVVSIISLFVKIYQGILLLIP